MPTLNTMGERLGASVFAQLEPSIAEAKRAGRSLVGLHIGDTHLAPVDAAHPKSVIPTLQDDALFRYGNAKGSDTLRAAIAAHYSGRHGEALINPLNQIVLGAGGTCALALTMRAILATGDEVLVLSPHWPLAPGIILSTGAVPIAVDHTTHALLASSQPDANRALALSTGLSTDLSTGLEQAYTAKTRAVYFANPNNPDGYVWSEAELRALYIFAETHDLWIFSDEVYADLTYGAVHRASSSFDEPRARTITLHSFSKSHALAGLRIGFALANAEVVARATRFATHDIFNVPRISEHCATMALTHGNPWLVMARLRYTRIRETVVHRLHAATIPFVAGAGGSYVFVDLRAFLHERSLIPFLRVAVGEGVLLTPGSASGACGGDGYEGFARLCFTAVAESEVERGVAALVRAAHQWRTGQR